MERGVYEILSVWQNTASIDLTKILVTGNRLTVPWLCCRGRIDLYGGLGAKTTCDTLPPNRIYLRASQWVSYIASYL